MGLLINGTQEQTIMTKTYTLCDWVAIKGFDTEISIYGCINGEHTHIPIKHTQCLEEGDIFYSSVYKYRLGVKAIAVPEGCE